MKPEIQLVLIIGNGQKSSSELEEDISAMMKDIIERQHRPNSAIVGLAKINSQIINDMTSELPAVKQKEMNS